MRRIQSSSLMTTIFFVLSVAFSVTLASNLPVQLGSYPPCATLPSMFVSVCFMRGRSQFSLHCISTLGRRVWNVCATSPTNDNLSSLPAWRFSFLPFLTYYRFVGAAASLFPFPLFCRFFLCLSDIKTQKGRASLRYP